jgi:hypothetical protein
MNRNEELVLVEDEEPDGGDEHPAGEADELRQQDADNEELRTESASAGSDRGTGWDLLRATSRATGSQLLVPEPMLGPTPG